MNKKVISIQHVKLPVENDLVFRVVQEVLAIIPRQDVNHTYR
jgi:hypothetical protein